MQNEIDQAQAVLREAQLVLSGDNLQVFLARCYEALGRWFDAETMYRAVYEACAGRFGTRAAIGGVLSGQRLSDSPTGSSKPRR